MFFSRRPGGPGRDGRRVANAIVGSNFNDVFSGDGNDNTLNGGFGFDHLDGRGGNDRLVGGNGSDTFVFAAVPAASNTNPSGTNFDTVADYAAGTDKIDLTALGLGSGNFAALQNMMTEANGNVTISVDATDHLTIVGTTIATLQAHQSDFLL